MTIGELIALSRELKRMSLRELADISGVDNASLSQIEHGHIKEPSFRKIVRIAAALDLSLDRLAKAD
jgi:transcriptional regulator with XRE-family HTH domain